MNARFNLYPTDAPPILGAWVRGRGGMIDPDGLRRALERHARGRADVGLCQPAPGHLAAYPHASHVEDGPEVAVSMAGLRWEVTP